MLNEDVCEKLQRLVIDENKIVTYKTLSRTLNIPVNSAKGFLGSFLTTYQAHNNLGAYYMIIGTQADELFQQRSKAVIVPEKDVEAVKSKFTSVSSLHVYCIYKGNLVDKCAIYNTDYGQAEDGNFNKLAVIVNPNAKIQPGKVVKSAVNQTPSNGTKKIQPAVNTAASTPPERNKTVIATPATTKKSPDIFNILQKAAEKKKSPVKKESANNVATTTTTSPDTQKNTVSKPSSSAGNKQKTTAKKGAAGNNCNVMSMFSKQAEKNALKPVLRPEAVKDNKDDDFQPSAPPPKKARPTPRKSTTQRKKKCPPSDDSDSERLKPMKKKHRRIMTADSESSSENEEAHDKAQRDFFNVEPPVPEPAMKANSDDEDDEPIPPTPLQTGKKKTLKLVTKTFQDEDGFFVTKKVKEYVTDSEGSDTEKLAKAAKIFSPKKAAAKSLLASRKQASLTSFFKQK